MKVIFKKRDPVCYQLLDDQEAGLEVQWDLTRELERSLETEVLGSSLRRDRWQNAGPNSSVVPPRGRTPAVSGGIQTRRHVGKQHDISSPLLLSSSGDDESARSSVEIGVRYARSTPHARKHCSAYSLRLRLPEVMTNQIRGKRNCLTVFLTLTRQQVM